MLVSHSLKANDSYDFDIILNSAKLVDTLDIQFIIAGKVELKHTFIIKINEIKLIKS